MTHPQQTTREVIEQLVEALDHCMDAITERGLNGSPDQAEKWGLQLPLARAEYAITAGKQAVEQTQGEAVDIDALCARIKAADDACADMDYMLDSNDCISVLRGTWRGPLLNDMPPHPQATEPAPRPFLEINYPQAGEHKHEYHYFGTTQSHRRCRHCNEPEPAPSTAGERDRTIVSLPIPASASDLKSDSAKELEEVIADLLMYAGDNGYGHIDYADTMRHAAALLSAPALPVPSDSDDLIKALADVRDLFQIPERGSKLEHAWMEAVAFPESVPAYVRACIAPAALPVGELPEPFHPRASHINPDYRDGWNAALAAAYSQPTTEESLVVAGAQPVREPVNAELVSAAERVSLKYGHDDDGTPSDWTEWKDLREAISHSQAAPVMRNAL